MSRGRVTHSGIIAYELESVTLEREMGRMRWLRGALSAITVLGVGAAPARAAVPSVPFGVFARTGIRLTDVVWTGRQFLYVDNTTNRVAAAPAAGMPIHPFATMPRQVEETRCRVSPGAHGFAAGDLFCHSPDNTIYRISADGRRVDLFASLPNAPRSDGALAFDTTGAFGYALLAATGRSGGTVRRIGSYPTPGGADEIAVAPARFGSASGQLLLAVDAGKSGSLVAMDAGGRTRALLTLPDGPNPLVVLAPGQVPAAGAATPGLYVTDTLSRDVFLAPAAALAPYLGDVVVGSELRGLFWAVAPRGSGFAAIPLATNLHGAHYNLEGALYVSAH